MQYKITWWFMMQILCSTFLHAIVGVGYSPFPFILWALNGIEYVTGFMKTDPNCIFGISKITNLKYLTHCESLMLGCSHANFTV